MNVSEASREYSVPRKSLENRIKKRVVHGTLPGPRRVLNDEEDQALVEYMKYMARGGFPMTRKITCTYAQAIAKHIPTTKADDTYDVLSGSSDEEDDACFFLCGKTQPPELISGNIDWIACRNCERWYHEQCIGHPVDDLYICHLCEE